MRFSGNAPPLTVFEAEFIGEQPVFLYSDPLSEHLLYARAAWGIDVLPEVPAAIPAIGSAAAPTDAVETRRLGELWTRAWASVWTMYCASYDFDNIPITGFEPRPELVDWTSLVSPSSLAPSGYKQWKDALPRPNALNPEYSQNVTAAQAAYTRGLRCVFVLPVDGMWHKAIQNRIMLVSTGLHDSTADLRAAFEDF